MVTEVSYQDLNPLSFLERSVLVYPEKTAVSYGHLQYSYRDFHDRVRRLAGALDKHGLQAGDKVAFMLPNIPPMLEGHYGPLWIGAILVAINVRLSSREIAYILNHSKAKVLILDAEFAPKIREIIDKIPGVTTFVQVEDTVKKADYIAGPDYESFLTSSEPLDSPVSLVSEIDTISINYTSGTTGVPKGVKYHARGAYLNALGEVIETGMNSKSSYLWTLPMFHCNGWCFTWAVTSVGGTHVCLRQFQSEEVFRLIDEKGVTHMCCAPTVLTALYSSKEAQIQDLSGLTILTAGAPPAPHVIRKMEEMGAVIQHAYGLTETYGPHTICAVQNSWDNMSVEERSTMKARQGVPYVTVQSGVRVVDQAMNNVPMDGRTVGEVVMRGNNVMSGYLDDIDATNEAFTGGWFHSGDLGVWHKDGYIELKDRSKDVIISGGENISSQEVEKVIMEHPGVLEVSVIGVPDTKWGEVPKAFVVRKPGEEPTASDIITFTRERIAHFKSPKHVQFGDLPKTATGKIQKYLLRDLEWSGHDKRIQGSSSIEE